MVVGDDGGWGWGRGEGRGVPWVSVVWSLSAGAAMVASCSVAPLPGAGVPALPLTSSAPQFPQLDNGAGAIQVIGLDAWGGFDQVLACRP